MLYRQANRSTDVIDLIVKLLYWQGIRAIRVRLPPSAFFPSHPKIPAPGPDLHGYDAPCGPTLLASIQVPAVSRPPSSFLPGSPRAASDSFKPSVRPWSSGGKTSDRLLPIRGPGTAGIMVDNGWGPGGASWLGSHGIQFDGALWPQRRQNNSTSLPNLPKNITRIYARRSMGWNPARS